MFFIFLIFIGFIIGLGSVTVIDIHGFLGRKSPYWTEASIRTHKVTKPLIWIGLIFVIIGTSFLYHGSLFLIQYIIFTCMILNGIFLSFYISPFLLKREKDGKSKGILPKKLQIKIIFSFIISFLTWWGSVVLFIYALSFYRFLI